MIKNAATFIASVIIGTVGLLAYGQEPSAGEAGVVQIKTGADRPAPTAVFPIAGRAGKRVSGVADNAPVKRFKILLKRSADGKTVARAVALDSFLNVVRIDGSDWRIVGLSGEDAPRIGKADPMRGLDAALLVERSLCSREGAYAEREIADFFTVLNNQDRACLATFNQTPRFKLELSEAGAVKLASERIKFDKSEGLSAPDRAAVGALNYLKGRGNGNKPVIIIISYCPDNASMTFMPEDVEKKAVELGAPVYVVAFDEAASDPCLMDITRKTGGEFFALESADSSELSETLKEIYLFEKFADEIELPAAKAESAISLRCRCDSSIAQAIPFRAEERLVAAPQVAALFDFESAAISARYDESLRSLAEVLIDNPTKVIELTGYCGAELLGGDSRGFLAAERAQSVKQKLVGMGVPAAQVRFSDYRFLSPNATPLIASPWSAELERRVEVRWLDPSLLPYELVESLYDSEDEAAARVKFYENEGLRAYYAPIIRGAKPTYGVKLWGYATQDEALEAAKNLKSRFKKDFTVK